MKTHPFVLRIIVALGSVAATVGKPPETQGPDAALSASNPYKPALQSKNPQQSDKQVRDEIWEKTKRTTAFTNEWSRRNRAIFKRDSSLAGTRHTTFL